MHMLCTCTHMYKHWHMHMHACTHTHTYTCTNTHNYAYIRTQVPCHLNSIVLFDTLSLDFEIAEVLLVAFGGQTRTLTSYAMPKEGVAWQLNQRLSPPEKLHVKVSITTLYVVFFILSYTATFCQSIYSILQCIMDGPSYIEKRTKLPLK